MSKERAYTITIGPDTEMWFGVYRGVKIKDIPGGYFLSLYNNIKKLDLKLKEFVRLNEELFETERQFVYGRKDKK